MRKNGRRFRLLAAVLLLAPLSGVVHGQEKAPAWTYTGDLAERAAENSVVLAVRKAASILPDPVLLQRLREDLLSIYAMEPGLAAAWAWPAWADAVLVRLEPEASLDEFVAALPAAWEATAEERPGVPWDLIRFRRPLQVGLAADHIAGLEGVVSAEPNFIGGDGGDVHWHPEVDLYVFEIGWGDCPAVCIHHDYRFVVLTTEGPVEIEGAAARELIGLEPPRGVPAEIRAAAGDRLTVGPDTLSDPWVGWPQAVEPQGGFFGPYELVLRGPYGFDAEPVRFAVRERGGSPVLAGTRLVSGWLQHEAFGWVWDQSYPWVWHPHHGWLYVSAIEGATAFWAYDRALGWTYWDETLYPWVSASGRWLFYFEGTTQPRVFFEASTGRLRRIE